MWKLKQEESLVAFMEVPADDWRRKERCVMKTFRSVRRKGNDGDAERTEGGYEGQTKDG